MLKLPTEKTVPITDPQKLSVLIYGYAKVGKSTFASQAPDALFIDANKGLAQLATLAVPVDTWEQVQEVIGALEAADKTKTMPYKTVVVDTIDDLYRLATEHLCRKHGVEYISMGTLGYGAGIAQSVAMVMSVVRKLHAMSTGLILLCHAVNEAKKTLLGVESNKVVPSLPKDIRKDVLGFVDVIGYAETEQVPDKATGKPVGIRHVLRTAPSPEYDAGDRTRKLPNPLPLKYAAFVAALTKTVEAKVAEAKPVQNKENPNE